MADISTIVGVDGSSYTIKDATARGLLNGHSVNKDVPANAAFTDTTYESKQAASGGTDLSLVTTGEKYNWNNASSLGAVEELRNTLNSEVATRQTYVRPNLLDNWYFVGGGSQLGDSVFPINQRGQTVYSGPGYGIDRFKSERGGSITVNSDCVTFVNTSLQLCARSLCDVLAGKTVTFSALDKNLGLKSATGVVQPYGTETRISVDFGGNRVCGVWFFATGSLQICRIQGVTTGLNLIAVKLELGSGQTLAHNEGTDVNPIWVLNEIPNYGEELFKCGTSTADSADPYANKTYNKVFSAKNRIEASEDFNNYRGINAIGFYSTNGMPTNAPASFGTLLVFQSASSSGCTQMYLAQGKIFVRQYGGNPLSWGSWQSISLS